MFILRLRLPRRSPCRGRAPFESRFSQPLSSPKSCYGGGHGAGGSGGPGRRWGMQHPARREGYHWPKPEERAWATGPGRGALIAGACGSSAPRRCWARAAAGPARAREHLARPGAGSDRRRLLPLPATQANAVAGSPGAKLTIKANNGGREVRGHGERRPRGLRRAARPGGPGDGCRLKIKTMAKKGEDL